MTADRDAAPAAEGLDLQRAIAALEGQHHAGHLWLDKAMTVPVCSECEEPWPCPTIVVIRAARPAPAAAPDVLEFNTPPPIMGAGYTESSGLRPPLELAPDSADVPAPTAAPREGEGHRTEYPWYAWYDDRGRLGSLEEWSNALATLLQDEIAEDDVSQEALITDAIKRLLARAAAPPEGGETFTEAELRTYAENLLASGPHAAGGRSILAMVQFLTTSHRLAAREAARGDREAR